MFSGVFSYCGARENTPEHEIIVTQARLYRAKMFVVGCITIALTTILVFPGSQLAATVDLIGNVIVSIYLAYCGTKTTREAL